MSESNTRERGIKVMCKRRITLDIGDGVLQEQPIGKVVVLSKELVKLFGDAVTKDLPESEDE